MTASFHQFYLSLVEDIERTIPVALWRYGDVDLWPLARMDLYLDIYWQMHKSARASRARRTLPRVAQALLERAPAIVSPADVVFLGNGASYEFIGGSWRDRYCDSLILAAEENGSSWFLLEGGAPHRRRPLHRPSHPTQMIALAGHLGARLMESSAEFPGHDALATLLARFGISALSLSIQRLLRRARIVSSTASVFQRVLRKLQPSLAFVVTWYADLGPAFVLACRRQHILSVDLQHCPQGRSHKAYHWSALPPRGYSTMPAVFWTWSQSDAAAIDRWADGHPWHRGFHGGPLSLAVDREQSPVRAETRFEKEILVALQSLDGHQETWFRLADEIERSPPGWRWWIRRHPASSPQQDRQYDRLVRLTRPNIVTGPASDAPLIDLLERMDAVVSLSSGAAVEASAFGVPALFLDREAQTRFPELFASGEASVLEDLSQLHDVLSTFCRRTGHQRTAPLPDISRSFKHLAAMASDYQELFAAE